MVFGMLSLHDAQSMKMRLMCEVYVQWLAVRQQCRRRYREETECDIYNLKPKRRNMSARS